MNSSCIYMHICPYTTAELFHVKRAILYIAFSSPLFHLAAFHGSSYKFTSFLLMDAKYSILYMDYNFFSSLLMIIWVFFHLFFETIKLFFFNLQTSKEGRMLPSIEP